MMFNGGAFLLSDLNAVASYGLLLFLKGKGLYMIIEPTVLVLGAGASMQFGFPSGAGLVDAILSTRQMSGESHRIFHKILETDYAPGGLDNFLRALRMSARPSIDAFLEHNPRFMEIGKLAIAAALIPFEDEYKLFYVNSWYKTLFQNMNTSLDQFHQNKLAVITYNYDRSLEHFLITALENAYEGVTHKEAVELVSMIPIIHLHGKLGEIPGLKDEAWSRSYINAGLGQQQLKKAAEGIKIIHENIGSDFEFIRAQELIGAAEKICFLGFGYDETNLKRLLPGNMINDCMGRYVEDGNAYLRKGKRAQFYGTTFGLKPIIKEKIESRFFHLMKTSSTIDEILGDHPILMS